MKTLIYIAEAVFSSELRVASAVFAVGLLVFGAGWFMGAVKPAVVLVALVGGVAALSSCANGREASCSP